MAAAVAVAITLFALVCLDSTNQGGKNYQPPTPRPFKALGFWYHDDFVDVDCSGYSCDDGEGNEAEPNDC